MSGSLRLHYLQHVRSETPGSILTWAEERGHAVTRTLLYENEPLPGTDGFDWLIIMGGSMGVHDEAEHPWLLREKAFIRETIASGKVVLGICLGAQLIADAIGGKVTVNALPEIGWHRIRWTDGARSDPLFSFLPKECTVFQWHNDTFSVLPPGATLLASSAVCAHQAFVYRGKVFGFQFHLESTLEMVREMASGCEGRAEPNACVQSPGEMVTHPEHIAQNREWMSELLNRLEKHGECRKTE
jgi:GMP synthase-like glutamine amidotransferase